MLRIAKQILIAVVFVCSTGWSAYAAEDVRKRIDVPAGELTAALASLARQAGVELIYQSAELAGLTTKGVSGNLTAREAVDKLLEGTPLTVRTDSSGAMLIGKPRASRDTEGTQAERQRTSSEQKVDPIRLEGIVVTAQKRDQLVYDVPMTIAAIGGDELATRGVSTYQDLAFAVPELAVAQMIPGQNILVLRGVGQMAGNLPMVGVYFDEVAASATSLRPVDLRIFDLDRVEVLFGPQGTLYGQGSVGGTVRFITRDPTFQKTHFSSILDASFTQDGSPSQRFVGIANVPIVDNELAFRVAGTFERTGGWIDLPAAGLKNVNHGEMYNVRFKGLWNVSDRVSLNAMVVVHRNDVAAPNGGEDENGNFVLGPFAPTQDQPTKNRYELYSMVANVDLGRHEFLSATSYFDNRTDAIYTNPAGTNWRVWTDTDRDKVFNQEFRLSTKATDPLTWTVGAFYQDADLNQDLLLTQGRTSTPALVNFLIPFPEKWRSQSYFGNAGYKVTPRLEVGGGARYFIDRHSAPLASGGEQESTFRSIDPRVYATIALTDDLKAFISAAKGFRSGGFNAITEGIPPQFDPDKVYSYEAGTKFAAWGSRIRGEVSAFYSRYKDMQLATIHPTLVVSYTGNLGEARIYGVDWSLAFYPGGRLSLGTAGNFIRDEVTEVPAGSQVLVGDRLNYIPKYNYTVFLQKLFNWAPAVRGVFRIDYAEKGKAIFASRTAGRFDESQVINLLNARIGASWKDFSVDFYGENLLNDRDRINPSTVRFSARPRPRTFGVRLSAEF
jgi:iron complex outermembrane recepter protein